MKLDAILKKLERLKYPLLILAFGLWFLAALAPEFRRNAPEAPAGKEAIRP